MRGLAGVASLAKICLVGSCGTARHIQVLSVDNYARARLQFALLIDWRCRLDEWFVAAQGVEVGLAYSDFCVPREPQPHSPLKYGIISGQPLPHGFFEVHTLEIRHFLPSTHFRKPCLQNQSEHMYQSVSLTLQ